MPTLEEMQELVQDHACLEDRMDAAIWIRQGDVDAWLVELLPDLPADRHPGRPVQFNPGRSFPHALHLIAANLQDLQTAIRSDPDLAVGIAQGQVLHGEAAAGELLALARSVRDAHAQTG